MVTIQASPPNLSDFFRPPTMTHMSVSNFLFDPKPSAMIEVNSDLVTCSPETLTW